MAQRLATTLAIVALLSVGTVFGAKIDETKIRCKVCDRSIAHIWLKGVELRKHCKLHNTDPRCRHTNIKKSAVEEMVNDACEEVAKTHAASLDTRGNFAMVPIEEGGESNNEPHVDAAITASCGRWVIDANTPATLSRFIYANLDAGKPTQAVLNPLQTKFCQHACAPAQNDDHYDEL